MALKEGCKVEEGISALRTQLDEMEQSMYPLILFMYYIDEYV